MRNDHVCGDRCSCAANNSCDKFLRRNHKINTRSNACRNGERVRMKERPLGLVAEGARSHTSIIPLAHNFLRHRCACHWNTCSPHAIHYNSLQFGSFRTEQTNKETHRFYIYSEQSQSKPFFSRLARFSGDAFVIFVRNENCRQKGNSRQVLSTPCIRCIFFLCVSMMIVGAFGLRGATYGRI